MRKASTETAILGGGCFWCIEPVFEELRGVRRVESGYAGGTTPDPSYQQVCRGDTGHAEVVRVEFEPAEISYSDILDVFFTVHDPTTLNRQGADVGSQYRSVILYSGPEQKRVAEEAIARIGAEGIWDDPIVTELAPASEFYPAEREHQEYYRRNPGQPYCQVVIAPKVAKFRKRFADRLRG